jgi:hypothetical protein
MLFFGSGTIDAPCTLLLRSNLLKRSSAWSLGLIMGYIAFTKSNGVTHMDSLEDLDPNSAFIDIIQTQRFQIERMKRLAFVSGLLDSRIKIFWVEIFKRITHYHELGAHASCEARPNNALELYINCVDPCQSMFLYKVLGNIHFEVQQKSDELFSSVESCNNWGVSNILLPKLYASHFTGSIILLAMRMLLMQHMIVTHVRHRGGSYFPE